jgi:hypothetical protein
LESKTQNGQFCNPLSPTSKTDRQISTGNKLTEHVNYDPNTRHDLETIVEVVAVWIQMSGVYKKNQLEKRKINFGITF